jgi:hypothetical protein
LRIVYGLLCAPDGSPVAIEVFDDNTADPKTVSAQIDELKRRFEIDHVAVVGDRCMITQARITDEVRAAPRAPAIRSQMDSVSLQLTLFHQRYWPASLPPTASASAW